MFFKHSQNDPRTAIAKGRGSEQSRKANCLKYAVLVAQLVIGKHFDYLLDLIAGDTLDYLLSVLGIARELQELPAYYPTLKIIALLIVEAPIAYGLVLLRNYSSSRFSFLTLNRPKRSEARLEEGRHQTAAPNDRN